MFALAVFSMSSFVACKDYDEDSYTDLKARLNGEITLREALAQQVSALQEALSKIKSCSCDPAKYASKDEFDKVDADKVVDEYAEMLGVPASVRANDEAVAAVREQRAQQAQRQQEAAAIQQVGELAKLGSVPTDENHAGGILKDAMENGGQA